ncbi:MAG: hypothetical protein ACRDNM_09160 [Gaiellaceae bacterium]
MTARDRRAVNDYRRRAFGEDPERRVAFVCECGDERCRRAVVLSAEEYDEACASGRAVVVEHEPPSESVSAR